MLRALSRDQLAVAPGRPLCPPSTASLPEAERDPLMPRDIPVGNGRLLITFDRQYQIRDIYFPHVGQENHGGAGPCRFGVHADVPGRHKSRLYWTSDEGWDIRQRYLRDTLTTSVALEHRDLRLSLYCNDVVDFHRP